MSDDLNQPLGQRPQKHRRFIHHIIAAVLATVLGVVVLGAIIEKLFSGKPEAAVAIGANPALVTKQPEVLEAAASAKDHDSAGHQEVREPNVPLRAAPRTTKTVTIIDGKTGARQELVIPATGD
jgi:hypothetical protein